MEPVPAVFFFSSSLSFTLVALKCFVYGRVLSVFLSMIFFFLFVPAPYRVSD